MRQRQRQYNYAGHGQRLAPKKRKRMTDEEKHLQREQDYRTGRVKPAQKQKQPIAKLGKHERDKESARPHRRAPAKRHRLSQKPKRPGRRRRRMKMQNVDMSKPRMTEEQLAQKKQIEHEKLMKKSKRYREYAKEKAEFEEAQKGVSPEVARNFEKHGTRINPLGDGSVPEQKEPEPQQKKKKPRQRQPPRRDLMAEPAAPAPEEKRSAALDMFEHAKQALKRPERAPAPAPAPAPEQKEQPRQAPPRWRRCPPRPRQGGNGPAPVPPCSMSSTTPTTRSTENCLQKNQTKAHC